MPTPNLAVWKGGTSVVFALAANWLDDEGGAFGRIPGTGDGSGVDSIQYGATPTRQCTDWTDSQSSTVVSQEMTVGYATVYPGADIGGGGPPRSPIMMGPVIMRGSGTYHQDISQSITMDIHLRNTSSIEPQLAGTPVYVYDGMHVIDATYIAPTIILMDDTTSVYVVDPVGAGKLSVSTELKPAVGNVRKTVAYNAGLSTGTAEGCIDSAGVNQGTSGVLVTGTFAALNTYVVKTDVVSATYVLTGHDNYVGGSAGSVIAEAHTAAQVLLSAGGTWDDSLLSAAQALVGMNWGVAQAVHGTYVAPVAAGYAVLAPGFGAAGGTPGTLAAAKIHDGTYGTLADGSVLVAAGGTYIDPANSGVWYNVAVGVSPRVGTKRASSITNCTATNIRATIAVDNVTGTAIVNDTVSLGAIPCASE